MGYRDDFVYRVSFALFPLFMLFAGQATEFHVASNGSDVNRGTRKLPFRTIQHAADLAQPGDVITVHKGVYRERINPLRGGESDRKRIVYQAGRGEKVEIKGSEVVKGWARLQDDVWKLTLSNSFFGSFNPFTDEIRGDWFDAKGRKHHTGAVYLDSDWLTEAAKLDEVLMPGGAKPAWLTTASSGFLLNVAWFRCGNEAEGAAKIPASRFAAQQGIQTFKGSEGGECVGWIEHGDWVRYDGVSMDSRSDQIDFRAASGGKGGLIEIRLNTPDGELLGTCEVKPTGDWQQWDLFSAKIKPVDGTNNLCLVFKGRKSDVAKDRGLNPQLWFAQVDQTNTTIWAQFNDVNPNDRLVEINVRRTVFYPDQPGRNFITVRGFTMRHAATPWAPPTAEQIGLIGTHWSKGWVIENNTISHSICSGIALGKHGDKFDNTSANTAEGYVKTIERAHAFAIPWTKTNIGHHIIRNNTITHCEQAGIVGSLGAAFCTVTDNTLHDIHIRRLFGGAEMSGIKFHAAIDTTIARNHIFRCCQALWLDWMAQGTRVTANLFHDNEDRDLFLEVNHGPFVVDNNLFLSPTSLLDMSEGGCFVHNLFAGKMVSRAETNRETPYHPAHSTEVAGLAKILGGDNRFYLNVFVGKGKPDAPATERPAKSGPTSGSGLWVYDKRPFSLQAEGNVFYFGARPYALEESPLSFPEHNPAIKLVRNENRADLQISLPNYVVRGAIPVITTERLGTALIPGVPYVNPDGAPLQLNTDYFGKRRSKTKPTPGPFENPGTGALAIKVR